MALLRYQLFTTYLVVFLAIWKALLAQEETILSQIPLSIMSVDTTKLCIQYLPLLALLSLAVYAIVSIGMSMLTFRDCPEAAKELEEQVKEAKIALKKKGIVGF